MDYKNVQMLIVDQFGASKTQRGCKEIVAKFLRDIVISTQFGFSPVARAKISLRACANESRANF